MINNYTLVLLHPKEICKGVQDDMFFIFKNFDHGMTNESIETILHYTNISDLHKFLIDQDIYKDVFCETSYFTELLFHVDDVYISFEYCFFTQKQYDEKYSPMFGKKFEKKVNNYIIQIHDFDEQVNTDRAYYNYSYRGHAMHSDPDSAAKDNTRCYYLLRKY